MRIRYAALLLILHPPVVAAARHVDTGICFYRYEDNGILNIRPSYVRIDGKKVAMLEGGGIECISLRPGTYTVDAYSGDPYDPHETNEMAWLSKKITVTVNKNLATYVHVWPQSSHATYTGPWMVELSAKAPSDVDFSE